MMNYSIVYIVGAGHSGSTLLDILLSRHSKIFGGGELCSYPGENKCSCGEDFNNCSVWKKFKGLDAPGNIKKTIFGKYIDRKNKNPVLVEEYLRKNKNIFNKIREVSGKDIITDSSKEVGRAELLRGENILFIHLVRNGLGVAGSYKRKGKGAIFSSFLWLWVNLRVEMLKKKDKRFITIKYENLVSEPKKELKKILDRLNLDFEERILDFSVSVKRHQLAGNRIRMRRLTEIKKSDSWKNRLNGLDKIIFYIIAGWLNNIYGY